MDQTDNTRKGGVPNDEYIATCEQAGKVEISVAHVPPKDNPGPKYNMPSLTGHLEHDPRSWARKGPCYSMRKKIKVLDDANSPGPKYAVDQYLTIRGLRRMPAYTHVFRHPPLKQTVTPGPARYRWEDAPKRFEHPKWTMAHRTHVNKAGSDAPPANKYSIPPYMGKETSVTRKKEPIQSIAEQYRHGGIWDRDLNNPGPAAVNLAGRGDVYKRTPPTYSVGKAKKDKWMLLNNNPGAGKYYPQKKKQGPNGHVGYTFGIRHSERKLPLIVDVASGCID